MVIYETINKINGKRYIGKDKHNDSTYLGSGKLLNNAIKKYGRENFVKTILEYCDSEDHMSERERHWIKITNAQTSNTYYNIGEGGNGGDNITNNPNRDEFIRKIKENRKTHPKWNPTAENKKNMKQAAQGRYTLKWFQDKYGLTDGERRYTERNRQLSVRYLDTDTKKWLSELTPDSLKHLLLHKTQEQIKQEYGITHKRLYKKYFEFWNCRTYSEVKRVVL